MRGRPDYNIQPGIEKRIGTEFSHIIVGHQRGRLLLVVPDAEDQMNDVATHWQYEPAAYESVQQSVDTTRRY
jgi:hypothetical protein